MTNKWTVEFKPKALKELKKFDKKSRNRIFHFLDSLVEDFDSPRNVGKAMTGGYKGLWRYRVGDYRLICQIQDGTLVVLVAHLGHRKEVYEN